MNIYISQHFQAFCRHIPRSTLLIRKVMFSYRMDFLFTKLWKMSGSKEKEKNKKPLFSVLFYYYLQEKLETVFSWSHYDNLSFSETGQIISPTAQSVASLSASHAISISLTSACALSHSLDSVGVLVFHAPKQVQAVKFLDNIGCKFWPTVT